MPSATTETRGAALERYVYLRALQDVIYTFALGDERVRVPIDASGDNLRPLDGLPGEPYDCDELHEYLDRLSDKEGDVLWSDVPELEDDPEYKEAERQTVLLTGRMLCRIAAASAYCARHADACFDRASTAVEEAGDA